MVDSRTRRCFLIVALLLSMHAPSEAARNQLDIAGRGWISSLDQESSEVFAEVEGHSDLAKFRCPPGLERHDNKSLKICIYQGAIPDLEDDDHPVLFENIGNSVPLLFEESSAFQLESQFLAEFASAATDRSVLDVVLNDVASLEVHRDVSFAERFEHWKHKVHKVEDNLKPGVFVLEHIVEHGVLMGVVAGLEAVAVSVEAGAIVTGEIAIHILEGVLVGAIGVLDVVLHWILPILLIPQTIYMIWRIRKHFKEITHHTKNFVMRLVFKSDCLEETTRMLRDGDEGELSNDVKEICGEETDRMLHSQMHRTNTAMEGIFALLEEVGRCLWPHNHRSYAKIGCTEAIYEPLRETHGHAGILYLALSLAVTYAHFTDDLLAEPWYGDLLEKEFGIELPNHHKTSLKSVLDQTLEVRAMACMQLLATHRAFERTFLRLQVGIKVWLQTYARETRSPSIRHSWWPCRKVFNSLDKDAGFCKSSEWAIGHGNEERSLYPQEADPCHSEWHGEYTSLWPEVKEAAEKKAKKEAEKAEKQKNKEAKRFAKTREAANTRKFNAES